MTGYAWAGGGNWLWMLAGLLAVIGVIVLVVWAVRRPSRAGATPTQGSSGLTPNQILSGRFARGEMSQQEFEHAKRALGPDGGGPTA
jgi:uncharacterized membrane protein